MKKKNTPVSIDKIRSFISRYADDYYKYGNLQFAIYDYELFENSREMGSPVPEYTRIYREVVKDFFKGADLKETARKYKLLRDGIIAKMEGVTAYTDRFTIYEYLLNRVELRFEVNKKDDEPFDDEKTAQSIVARIFRDQDNNTINLKLQTMLEQLPVRVTTDRFFDILKNSLELYINGQKSSVEKLDYMIRSASGLYKPEGMDYFQDLIEADMNFETLKFKDITEADFDKYSDTLQSVTTEITELSDYFALLENAVNQLGIMIFTKPYASEEAVKEAESTKALSEWIVDNAEGNNPVPAELVDLFKLGEGKLEGLFEAIQELSARMDGFIDSNMDLVDEAGLSGAVDDLEKCQMLASDSIYVRLDEEETADIADEAYVSEVTEKLKTDLTELFSDKEQKRKRAIMAAVLGELPVFFSSKRAVLDYVTNSLRNCSDMAEKRMSVELLFSAFDEFDGM